MAISIVGVQVWVYWVLANVYSRCISRTRKYKVVVSFVIDRFSVYIQFKKCNFDDDENPRRGGGGEFAWAVRVILPRTAAAKIGLVYKL